MPRSLFLLVILAPALLPATPAYAHKLYVFAAVEGRVI